MSDLLSAQDWVDFRSAIKDVTDTFADVPITYTRILADSRKVQLFNQGSQSDRNNEVTHNFNGLVVYEKTDSDAMVTNDPDGKVDMSEGYVLFNYEDLRTEGLIDGNEYPIFNPDEDKLTANGIEYQIEGVNPLGPADGSFAVCKVHIKKRITPQ